MLLDNVVPAGTKELATIRVAGHRISALQNAYHLKEPRIDLAGAAAFPGLVNSHDHLDFNCFVPLGKKKYNNYIEWGNDIHNRYKQEINAVLNIPAPLRSMWGMYKNLLAGITTVVHHGDRLVMDRPLINVHQRSQNLHSVAFEKNWKIKINNPRYLGTECVIHAGEGVDQRSHDEVDKLLRWNCLRRKLIAVHGVAMTAALAKRFGAIVWCPWSNAVLFGAHAPIEHFKMMTPVVFGTDSTLTGHWNIWEHLRLARSLNKVNDEELVAMVTGIPATLWNLGSGRLAPGCDADIIIARTDTGAAAASDFLSVSPEAILLVVHRGNIRMFDESISSQVAALPVSMSAFSRVSINGVVKFVEGDVPALMSTIKTYYRAVQFPLTTVRKQTSYQT